MDEFHRPTEDEEDIQDYVLLDNMEGYTDDIHTFRITANGHKIRVIRSGHVIEIEIY